MQLLPKKEQKKNFPSTLGNHNKSPGKLKIKIHSCTINGNYCQRKFSTENLNFKNLTFSLTYFIFY